MSSEIYQEQILDHYRHPRNYGSLPHPDATFEDSNPLCGDVVTMDVAFDGERIADIRFRGAGCAISQASASMLTELALGHTREEARAITRETVLLETRACLATSAISVRPAMSRAA